MKEDLNAAGVRFVYFSPRNMRRSKPVAEKIGIELDWNCAISLRPLAAAINHHGTRESTTSPSNGDSDNDNEDDGGDVASNDHGSGTEGDGVGNDRARDPHRYISQYADWDVHARMPHGYKEIQHHLQYVDNGMSLPLHLSVMTLL